MSAILCKAHFHKLIQFQKIQIGQPRRKIYPKNPLIHSYIKVRILFEKRSFASDITALLKKNVMILILFNFDNLGLTILERDYVL
jgi:hypothetical protein